MGGKTNKVNSVTIVQSKDIDPDESERRIQRIRELLVDSMIDYLKMKKRL